MKVDRICFEQLFPTGVYANQRLRMEILIEDKDIGYGDSEEGAIKKAFVKARDLVEKSFIELNPQIKWNEPPILGNQSIPEIDPKKKDKVEKDIDNATTKEEVLKLQADAFQYGFHEQYVLKLKSFQ